eukprot:SAG11_NODE_15823_length_565_cov_1.100858_1_plen_72_part_00
MPKLQLQSKMMKVWKKLASATDPQDGRNRAELFMRLPSKDELPLYYAIIEQPTDLDTILQKVQGGRSSRFK